MQTKTEFYRSVYHKKLDYDGVPASQPYQCVDVIKYAFERIWNIKNFSFTLAGKNPNGYARSLWENFESYPQLKGKAYKVPNTPDYVPKLGDIIVWDSSVGKAGHVAFALGKDTDTTKRFTSLDQNYGKKYYCDYIEHNYKGVYGAIRMIQKTTTANLNIRAGAGKQYECIGTLDKGTLVYPLEEKNNYTRIGEKKWVSSKYLE